MTSSSSGLRKMRNWNARRTRADSLPNFMLGHATHNAAGSSRCALRDWRRVQCKTWLGGVPGKCFLITHDLFLGRRGKEYHPTKCATCACVRRALRVRTSEELALLAASKLFPSIRCGALYSPSERSEGAGAIDFAVKISSLDCIFELRALRRTKGHDVLSNRSVPPGVRCPVV